MISDSLISDDKYAGSGWYSEASAPAATANKPDTPQEEPKEGHAAFPSKDSPSKEKGE